MLDINKSSREYFFSVVFIFFFITVYIFFFNIVHIFFFIIETFICVAVEEEKEEKETQKVLVHCS